MTLEKKRRHRIRGESRVSSPEFCQKEPVSSVGEPQAIINFPEEIPNIEGVFGIRDLRNACGDFHVWPEQIRKAHISFPTRRTSDAIVRQNFLALKIPPVLATAINLKVKY